MRFGQHELYRHFISSLIFIFAGSVVLAGCQTSRRRHEPTTTSPSQSIGSVESTNSAFSTPNQEAPSSNASAPSRRVGIILGPGGAKSMAHVGVLKVLQQKRIPVAKIVGLEWGAFVAALYGNKGQVNDVEWKLYKMEQQGLPHKKGFFTRDEATVKVMDSFLDESFSGANVESARIPFTCPMRSVWSGVLSWQNKGSLKDAVRRCLPYPPTFKIQGNSMAGATQVWEAIDLLRKEGIQTILFVNVLGSAMPGPQDTLPDSMNSVIIWQEVKRAMLDAHRAGVDTLNVDTSAYPVSAFESKKELISLGESAAANGLKNFQQKIEQ